MAFQLGAVQEAQSVVDRDVGWFALEGRAFGDTSPYPLKVKVGTATDSWSRFWQEGCDDYNKTLKSHKKKQEFAKQAQNPLLMPPKVLAMANRSAIENSGALHKVAWCGPAFPSFDDVEAWFRGELEVLANSEPVPAPEGFSPSDFKHQPDGTYMLPESSDPPPDWVASADQVERLIAMNSFVNQVGNCRRLLEEEGAQEDAEELESSGRGLTIRRGTSRSQRVSETASTS